MNEIICFKCARFNPSVSVAYHMDTNQSEEWVSSVCEYHHAFHTGCGDFRYPWEIESKPKPEEVICFKCTHFKPIMRNIKDTDKWIDRPCEHSGFMCTNCRDFKEIL